MGRPAHRQLPGTETQRRGREAMREPDWYTKICRGLGEAAKNGEDVARYTLAEALQIPRLRALAFDPTVDERWVRDEMDRYAKSKTAQPRKRVRR